jgi:hypothetical protein
MPGGLVQLYRVGADATLGIGLSKERWRNVSAAALPGPRRSAGVQLNVRGVTTDCSAISSDALAGRTMRKIGTAAASGA